MKQELEDCRDLLFQLDPDIETRYYKGHDEISLLWLNVSRMIDKFNSMKGIMGYKEGVKKKSDAKRI